MRYKEFAHDSAVVDLTWHRNIPAFSPSSVIRFQLHLLSEFTELKAKEAWLNGCLFISLSKLLLHGDLTFRRTSFLPEQFNVKGDGRNHK